MVLRRPYKPLVPGRPISAKEANREKDDLDAVGRFSAAGWLHTFDQGPTVGLVNEGPPRIWIQILPKGADNGFDNNPHTWQQLYPTRIQISQRSTLTMFGWEIGELSGTNAYEVRDRSVATDGSTIVEATYDSAGAQWVFSNVAAAGSSSNTGAGGTGPADSDLHTLLSVTHTDTVPYSPPVKGDLVVGTEQAGALQYTFVKFNASNPTYQVTLNSVVTNGSTIIVRLWAKWTGNVPQPLPTISDSQGNTYTLDASAVLENLFCGTYSAKVGGVPATPTWPTFGGASTFVGTSPSGRVNVWYDRTLGQQALQNAVDLLANADWICKSTDGYFGVIGGVVNVIIFAIGGKTDGTGGADHAACNFVTGQNLEVCASFGRSDRVQGLFAAELAECYMGGTLCGVSTGEALSRWVGAIISNNALTDFATATKWFNAGEPDWVDATEATDLDPVSVGCGMAFVSWLLKTYTFPTIAQEMVVLGAAGTLAQAYAVLSGNAANTAFPNFLLALNALGGVSGDDPFGTRPAQPGHNPTLAPITSTLTVRASISGMPQGEMVVSENQFTVLADVPASNSNKGSAPSLQLTTAQVDYLCLAFAAVDQSVDIAPPSPLLDLQTEEDGGEWCVGETCIGFVQASGSFIWTTTPGALSKWVACGVAYLVAPNAPNALWQKFPDARKSGLLLHTNLALAPGVEWKNDLQLTDTGTKIPRPGGDQFVSNIYNFKQAAYFSQYVFIQQFLALGYKLVDFSPGGIISIGNTSKALVNAVSSRPVTNVLGDNGLPAVDGQLLYIANTGLGGPLTLANNAGGLGSFISPNGAWPIVIYPLNERCFESFGGKWYLVGPDIFAPYGIGVGPNTGIAPAPPAGFNLHVLTDRPTDPNNPTTMWRLLSQLLGGAMGDWNFYRSGFSQNGGFATSGASWYIGGCNPNATNLPTVTAFSPMPATLFGVGGTGTPIMYAAPIVVPAAVTIDYLACFVSSLGTASGVNIVMGIYSDTAPGDPEPNALLGQCQPLIGAGAGFQKGAVSISLTPGMYWLAIMAFGIGGSVAFSAIGQKSGSIAPLVLGPWNFCPGGYDEQDIIAKGGLGINPTALQWDPSTGARANGVNGQASTPYCYWVTNTAPRFVDFTYQMAPAWNFMTELFLNDGSCPAVLMRVSSSSG